MLKWTVIQQVLLHLNNYLAQTTPGVLALFYSPTCASKTDTGDADALAVEYIQWVTSHWDPTSTSCCIITHWFLMLDETFRFIWKSDQSGSVFHINEVVLQICVYYKARSYTQAIPALSSAF